MLESVISSQRQVPSQRAMLSCRNCWGLLTLVSTLVRQTSRSGTSEMIVVFVVFSATVELASGISS